MRNVRVLSNHERALLAHQCMFREKIARFNISQFYVIKINHWLQMTVDKAEFTPKELFFVNEPSSQCQNTTVSMIKTSLATTNAQPAIIWCRIWSWSPMPCEKHGPRDSVDKNRGRRPRFLSLLRPEGHVFHTAWGTMIKCYYSTLADWFFSMFYSHKYEF